MTGENKDLAHEWIYLKPDSLIGNALWLMTAMLIAWGISYYSKMEHKVWNRLAAVCQKPMGRLTARYGKGLHMDFAAFVVSALFSVLCIYWVGASNTAPQADQFSVCSYADAFNNGDYSGLEKGAYVGVYRQQLGLITLLRILFAAFGSGNYRAFQYFSAVMAGCLIFFGYQFTKEISDNHRLAGIYYLILAVLCVPLYVYVPFVYGEIVSSALLLLSAWMLSACLKRFSWARMIVLGLAAGAAVWLRQNALIILIGFFIVILVKLISRKDRYPLFLALSMAVGVLLFQGLVQNAIYGDKIPEDSKPMPAILFIAMGCNWDGQNPGWYNWYNWETYQEYDCDKEAASEAAWDTITEFNETCRADSEYTVNFFVNKLAAQWEAPMYQCLAMNNKIAGEQSGFAESVYFGKLRGRAEGFMNIYQLVIYGSVFYLLIAKWKKWNEIEPYALLIGIFGGFLFTMIWEAKTRYVLPYFLFMIPYAAVGIENFNFKKMFPSIFQKGTKNAG